MYVHTCVLTPSVVSDSLLPRGLKSARLLCAWDSPGNSPGYTGLCSHFLLQGNLLNLEIEPTSPALASRCFTTEPPGKAIYIYLHLYILYLCIFIYIYIYIFIYTYNSITLLYRRN